MVFEKEDRRAHERIIFYGDGTTGFLMDRPSANRYDPKNKLDFRFSVAKGQAPMVVEGVPKTRIHHQPDVGHGNLPAGGVWIVLDSINGDNPLLKKLWGVQRSQIENLREQIEALVAEVIDYRHMMEVTSDSDLLLQKFVKISKNTQEIRKNLFQFSDYPGGGGFDGGAMGGFQ